MKLLGAAVLLAGGIAVGYGLVRVITSVFGGDNEDTEVYLATARTWR